MTDENMKMFEKPLDKMTVTELREIAKEIPDITGAHGMKKVELLVAIKEAKGIVDAPPSKPSVQTRVKTAVSIKELKALIRALKEKRRQALEAHDKKLASLYRRKISRLKKKTRLVA
jgi:hypothetical protein